MTAAASCGRRCRLPSVALAAMAGALFGAGLLLSGMTRPAKVIGFLDVTRGWDPSLAFVMGGAVAVYAAAYRLIVRRLRQPWLDGAFHLPTRRDVDGKLIAGAALFGIGWGLVGLCPGPAVTALFGGNGSGRVFVVAMLAGIALAWAPRPSVDI